MTHERPSAAAAVMMCCLVGMCVVIGLLFLIAEPAGGHGAAHAEFKATMYQGSTGSDRLGTMRWVGLGFALMQALFFVTSLTLGTKQRGALLVWFVAGGLLYLASFVALVVAESMYVQGDAREIVLGLPVPTAIMIYVVGGVPLLFSVIYVWKFDRWVLKSEDLERVTALAQRQKQQQAKDAE